MSGSDKIKTAIWKKCPKIDYIKKLSKTRYACRFYHKRKIELDLSSSLWYCTLCLTIDSEGKNATLAVIFVTLLSLICDWFTTNTLGWKQSVSLYKLLILFSFLLQLLNISLFYVNGFKWIQRPCKVGLNTTTKSNVTPLYTFIV